MINDKIAYTIKPLLYVLKVNHIRNNAIRSLTPVLRVSRLCVSVATMRMVYVVY